MIGQSAGKDYAYVLGVYLGDGCVTWLNDRGKKRKQFRLNTIDEDFARATAKALTALYSEYKATVCRHSVKGGRDNWALSFRAPELCEWLVSETSAKQQIPAWVLEAPREDRIAFVAGLMDSEGYVAYRKETRWAATNRNYMLGYKSCDAWIPDFLRILDGLGVRYGSMSVEKPRKAGYKTPTGFRIKIQSWIDAGCYFNIRRKQDRIDLWASKGAYESRSLHPRRSTSETLRCAA